MKKLIVITIVLALIISSACALDLSSLFGPSKYKISLISEDGTETAVTYDQLKRSPDRYKGQTILIRGRLCMDLLTSDVVSFVQASKSEAWLFSTFFHNYQRLDNYLKDDMVEVVGVFDGLDGFNYPSLECTGIQLQ